VFIKQMVTISLVMSVCPSTSANMGTMIINVISTPVIAMFMPIHGKFTK